MRLFALTVVVVLLGMLTGCPAPVRPDAPPERMRQAQVEPQTSDSPSDALDAVVVTGTREYQVTQRLRLVNRGSGAPEKQHLWLALIQDIPPYQEVLSAEIDPAGYQDIADEYGNQYAEFDFSGMQPGTEIVVSASYRVRVYALTYDLSDCQGPFPGGFTGPELHVESVNPQIIALAAQLAAGRETACLQARAFYDYIGDHLVYSYNGRDWGAQAALGPMGADCTEYASLMIALSRAAGIPARYLAGLSYFPEGSEAAARTEHAWAEIYLPGAGWAPMDPTLGRSSVARAAYFARLPADHIIVTRGRKPSTLRGANYFSHLYWPGHSTDILVEDAGWIIEPH